MKKKTILKGVCGILAALMIILAAGAWAMFGTFIQRRSQFISPPIEDGSILGSGVG